MPASRSRRLNERTLSGGARYSAPDSAITSVLHVSQPIDGGVASYVAALALDQRRDGYAVAVACPRGDLARRVADIGAVHLQWDAVRAPGVATIGEVRRLNAIVAAVGPDILHLHSSKAGLAGRLVRGRPPTVFQPHGWSWEATGNIVGFLATLWERFAASRCDVVITVGEEERQRAETAGVRARWAMVENGVDLERFAPTSAEERVAARRAVGLPEAPTVVCVGTFRTAKGLDVLLKAWPLVRRSVPESLLALVGDGPERPRIERLAGPGVVLAGHRDDVRPWLVASDVVAVPSRRDALSLSLLEAMACGRSIVASAVPGIADIITGAGAIVPIEDPPALAHAITERLLDPSRADREGTLARKRAEERFDWRRVTAEISAVYSGLLANEA